MFVDAFSKWRFCVKTKGRTTGEYIEGLKTFLSVVGRVDSLVSDIEGAFNSKRAKDFYTEHGITHLPAKQEGDHLHSAIVESENKSFRRFLNELAKEEEWPQHLADYVFTENSRSSLIPQLSIFDTFLPSDIHLSTIAVRKALMLTRDINDLKAKENFLDFTEGERVLIRGKEGLGHKPARSGIVKCQRGTGVYEVEMDGKTGYFKHDRLIKIKKGKSFFDTSSRQLTRHAIDVASQKENFTLIPMEEGKLYFITDGNGETLGKCLEVFNEKALMHEFEKSKGKWLPIWQNEESGEFSVRRKKKEGELPFTCFFRRELISREAFLNKNGGIREI
jgi:hypothetical protein